MYNKCITSDKKYGDDEFRTHIDWPRLASNNYFKLCKNGSIAGVVIRIDVFLIPTESVDNEGLQMAQAGHTRVGQDESCPETKFDQIMSCRFTADSLPSFN